MSDAPERIWLSDTDDVLFEDDEVGTPYTLTSTIPAMIAAAVAEAEAKAADIIEKLNEALWGTEYGRQDHYQLIDDAEAYAAAIRARGAK